MNRIIIKILLFIFVLSFVFLRPVNPDEPYYTLSSSEVMKGKIPYEDFLFHQTPVMLYVYSIVSYFGFWSLILGRLLSVIMMIAGFILLFNTFIKNKFSKREQNLFIFLFFLNGFFIDWMTVIRVYALSVFMLSAGVVCFYKFAKSDYGRIYLLLTSIIFTLLVFVKIVFAANLVVSILFSLYFLWKKDRANKVIYLAYLFLPVVILPLLFILPYYGIFDKIHFNLLTINYINREHHLFSFGPALTKFLLFFLVPQNLLIIVLLFASGSRYDFFEKFIILNVLAYAGIHLFAQMLPEYLSVIFPFILLLAVTRYKSAESNIGKISKGFSGQKIGVIVCALYLLFFFFSETNIRYYISGKEELMPNAIQLFRLDQKLPSVNGEKVLSSWWGYSAYMGKDQIVPIDYLSYYIFEYVSKEEIDRYGIKTPQACEKIIREKKADLIVYDTMNPLFLEKFAAYIESNYINELEYNNVIIYRKKD